jgi:pyrophosphatase PpaX
MIFDLDGTLADNFPVVMQTYRQTFSRYTMREYSDADIVAMFGPNVEGIIKRVVPDRWQDAVDTFYSLYDHNYVGYDAAVPGLSEVFAALDGMDIYQTVVTGGSLRSAEITLKHIGLLARFERIYAGSIDRNRKSEAISEALSVKDVQPCEAAYVGDSPHDMYIARQAGVAPMAAAWTKSAEHFAEDLAQSDPLAMFTDCGQFARWIRSNRAR